MLSGCGARVELEDDPLELFGEVGGRAVLACDPDGGVGLERLATELGDPLRRTGTAGGAPCSVSRCPPAGHPGSHLMCGVFGIRSEERDVSRLAYFGLFALQHRGQESAGIAVSDGGRLTVLRDMGLVAQVFNEQQLQALPGEVAIGHTRYSTTGANRWANAQPLVHHGRAHDRARAQRQPRQRRGAPCRARGGRRTPLLRLGLRGDRGVGRARSSSLATVCCKHDGRSRRRVLGDRSRRGRARRVPRSLRVPTAHARPARGRLGRRLRDLRARPHRRRGRPRRAAGR